MNNNGIRVPIIESLIMSSPEPLPAQKIAGLVDGLSTEEIDRVVDDLNDKYLNNDLSFRIRRIAGGYQFYIIEDYARHVEELFTRRRNVRLTRAALETLAIVSYRQPVTKIDIEMIRGVASDSVLHTLLERKLITIAGRAETVGKPLLYKTTDDFLQFFNLNSLNDLPRMEEIEELLATGDSELQQDLPFALRNNGAGQPAQINEDDTIDELDDMDEIDDVDNTAEENIESNGNEEDLETVGVSSETTEYGEKGGLSEE
jgi:segregation and condensation protein B